jgi:hypothetical protein
MNDSATAASSVEYKVVLAGFASEMILAIPGDGTFRLPRVFIPKWTRPAEEITRELRDNWNLNTVVVHLFPNQGSLPTSAVAEVIDTRTAKGDSFLRLCGIGEIDRTELDTYEREQVYGVLSGSKTPSGPFSRLGWLKDAQEWIQNSLGDRPVDFATDFRQYNAGDTFALVRFATCSGSAYWLKATGEPNKHEFTITTALSELFPQYLPPLVAKREDWNAWVTEDVGDPLGCVQDLEILARAVEALADLQILSLDYVSRLSAAGCMDRNLKVVQSHLPEIRIFLEDAMRNQTSSKVRPVTSSRLREIGVIVDQACNKMYDLDIPASLVNGDINLDNILYDGGRFRFTDWAEGGIGNPFLTFQQVIQHVIRDGKHSEWVPSLCHAYRKKWNALLTRRQIDRAFALMPLITMADYLYGRGDWLSSPRRDEPWFQSFARTLGRSMDRTAEELLAQGVLSS